MTIISQEYFLFTSRSVYNIIPDGHNHAFLTCKSIYHRGTCSASVVRVVQLGTYKGDGQKNPARSGDEVCDLIFTFYKVSW